jgi:hypothetical protein
MTPRTTRADRLAHPTTRDAVRAVAEARGACLHPVQLRRISTTPADPPGSSFLSALPPRHPGSMPWRPSLPKHHG